MSYSEKEIVSKLQFALDKIDVFYKEDLVNYLGRTSDSNKLYNEVVAEFVYNHIIAFSRITKVTRQTSYKTDLYKSYDINQSNMNTIKQLTLKLFKQSEFKTGRIIDCQTPIFNCPNQKHYGKLDVMLYTKDKELFILKTKLAHSKQTMLRFILEGLTAYQRLDYLKLIEDFRLDRHTKVKQAPLVFKNSSAYKELNEIRPQLNRLMAHLDLFIFVIEKTHHSYRITRHHYSEFQQPLQSIVSSAV